MTEESDWCFNLGAPRKRRKSDKLKIKSDIIEKMVFEFYYFKITGS